jgi:two-component system phosphate regulon sensor histidine kinase PhoR
MFKRRKLIWQLYRPYLLILVISLLSVAVFASNFLKNLYYKEIVEQLKDNAHLFEASLTKTLPDLPSDNFEKADKLCKEAGSRLATRFTVILPDGTVIGDSHEDPFMQPVRKYRLHCTEKLASTRGSAALLRKISSMLRSRS